MGGLTLRAQDGMASAATFYTGSYTMNKLQLLQGTTVLAEFSLSWTLVGNGIVSATGLPKTVTAQNSGTVDGAKLVSGDPAAFIQFDSNDVGVTGSGKPIEISSLSITDGQPVRLTNMNVKAPSTTTA